MCWQRLQLDLELLTLYNSWSTRNPAANAAFLSGFSLGKDDKAKPSREKKVSTLFAEWYKIYELHGTNEATCTRFLSQLQQTGYFNGDDMSDRFFRHLMELSVAFCLSTEGISSRSLSFQSSQSSQNLSFLAIDVYAKPVVFFEEHEFNAAYEFGRYYQ
ncbi:uncharacterized protein LOC114302239 [Camellia sinensis]|uniref:uncharacterized protein LOC114302239 n=1 Tax=Camellia sinensis TaxID=4442 RepID=UPI001036D871|nr:uncharacterized protein LOC114302239 [Camellia sinensis]